MPQIEAAILDIDGTIIDTSDFILEAYEHTLAHHDLPARTREEIASQIGKKIEDCYAFLAPGQEAEKLIAVHHAFQNSNISLVKPYKHADVVLKRLVESGMKLGLYTGRRENVVASLDASGIESSIFSVIIDAKMYNKGKPDPEGLYMALDKLGVASDAAAMIGDAALDIEAGKAANVGITIGITHGFGSREELEASQADYLIDSLDQLPGILQA
jgi:HAD superfamily hydrolase (TIGR01549 family)